MKVQTVAISALTPDPRNARKHDQRNLEVIAASLSQFGQRKPIVVTADKVVIAGNGTLEAAKSLGWTDIAVAQVPDDWDDATIRAYALADNRSAELAEWDEQILASMLDELAIEGWNINELGFDLPSAEKEAEPLLGDPDDVPESVPSKTVPGDVWLLGPHRLVCGDATSPTDLETLMNGKKADIVWTDPPYNVAVQGVAGTIMNDDMDTSAFREFIYNCYLSFMEALKDGGVIYVAHGESERAAFTDEFLKAGLKLSQVLIWVKNSATFSRQDFNWQHEPILYGWKEGAGHYFCGDFTRTTVIDDAVDLDKLKKEELVELLKTAQAQKPSTVVRHDRPSKSELHPTMKPVSLIERMLEWSSKPGELVLDLFGGSGSTLIAAHKTNRTAYLMELDPHYCDVICARFQTLTGVLPIAESTGNEHDFIA